jgi:hypothetical protein
VRPVARELEHANEYPEKLKQRYLPRMTTGEVRAGMAPAEPGGGSDLQAMTTTARPRHRGISILLVEHGEGLETSRDLARSAPVGYRSAVGLRPACRTQKMSVLPAKLEHRIQDLFG